MEPGDYIDARGRIWHCIAEKEFGRIVCRMNDGSYTVASEKTWKRWSWKPAPLSNGQ